MHKKHIMEYWVLEHTAYFKFEVEQKQDLGMIRRIYLGDDWIGGICGWRRPSSEDYKVPEKKTSNKKPSAKFVALPIAVKGDGFTIILPGLGLEYTHIHLKGGVLFVQIGLFGAM